MIPFLKWPGGKRWLVQKYSHLFPKTYNRYIEPFLGGGAVYFHMMPDEAILSDINNDVITVYSGIQRSHNRFSSLMAEHQKNHSREYYYDVRRAIPDDAIERAARVLYLNRVCFNGIYRVNRLGEFNVPIGTKTAVTLPTDDFPAVSRQLQKAELHAVDFKSTISKAKKDDFLFADPPYTVRHNNNGFIKYNQNLFSWEDQVDLSLELIAAKERGVRIVSTNANHSSVRELYEGHGFNFTVVNRYSGISAASESRRHFEELVIAS